MRFARARLRAWSGASLVGLTFVFLPGVALASGGAIRGEVVTTSSTPVAASVSYSPCPTGLSCVSSTSPLDGSFQFTGVPDGTYSVTVVPSDRTLNQPPPATVTVSAGVASPNFLFITVTASTTVSLSGVVTDNHGGPLPGQQVTLNYLTGASGSISTASDSTGHYQLWPLKNTTYWIGMTNRNAIELHAPAKYDLRTDSTLPLSVSTSPVTLDLVLPEVRIAVCIVDSLHHPVQNALLQTDQSVTLGLSLGGRPASGSDWYDGVGYPVTGSTGCASLWLFPNLNQHILTVTPQASDLATMAVTSFQIAVTAASDGATVGPLQLAAPATFSGSLVDSAGAPLPGQRVEVQQANLGASAPWLGSAGDTPAFAIPGLVLNAPYNVRVSRDPSFLGPYNGPDQYSLQTASPLIMTGAPVTLTMPAPASPVTVTANGGAMPVSGVVLTAPNPNSGSGLTLAGVPATGSDSLSSPWVVTGSDGVGRLWLFPSSNPYTVLATSRDRACSSGSVALLVPGPARLDLTCAVRVSGTVLDAAGTPLSGQTVTLTNSLGATYSAVMGAGGAYSIEVPGPGAYTLTLSGANGAVGAVPPVYRVSTQLQLSGDRTGLNLQAPFLALDVLVTSAGGAPLAGAQIGPPPSAVAVTGLSFAGLNTATAGFDYGPTPIVTGSDGRVRIWLLPGAYSLTASSGGLTATATISEPGTPALTIVLGATTPTPSRICDLVRQYEAASPTVARDLCQKLGIGPGGDPVDQSHLRLQAFAMIVRGQVGKTLTPVQAGQLLRMAAALPVERGWDGCGNSKPRPKLGAPPV